MQPPVSPPFADRFIAHRGWRCRFPENTLVGIEAAIAAGAKHVEIDIQLSADHVPILCHDKSLLRLCGRDLDINTLSHAQLAGFSAYEPERLGEQFLGTPLSTLAECVAAIESHPDVTLYVEIKRQSLRCFGADVLLHAVLPVLAPIRRHCLLISFDIDILHHARRAGWETVAPVLSNLEQLGETAILQLAPQMVFCDCDLLVGDNPLQQIPFPVAVYEIDQYADAERWFGEGVALVESFSVGELIAFDKEVHHGG